MRMKQLLFTALLVCGAIVNSGCLGVAAAGVGAGTAMYVKRDMNVTSGKPFEEVFSAVGQTCKELNFNVSKSEQKAFKGTVVADGDFGRVVFEVRAKSPGLTNVSIKVGAFGDRGASELIHDKLKPKL